MKPVIEIDWINSDDDLYEEAIEKALKLGKEGYSFLYHINDEVFIVSKEPILNIEELEENWDDVINEIAYRNGTCELPSMILK